ncbi:MAG: SDR family NAD(P)-dependent oxidoreductase [Dietzia psychralcaliphila]
MRVDQGAAIVTGGASGLGAATVAKLADLGADVYAIDLPSALDAVSDEPRTDRRVTYIAADVTAEDEVRSAIATATQARPLRVIVNCAGIAPPAKILSRDGAHDLEQFRRVVSVNLTGTFTVVALGAEAIAQADPEPDGQRGVIVNTASIAAFDGQEGQAAYAASKAAVVGMTLPAARDLARYGIRICTIAPGMVETQLLAGVSDAFKAGLASGVQFPARMGRPAEFAQLAVSIIEHDYLNGETIRMDGGLRMAPR